MPVDGERARFALDARHLFACFHVSHVDEMILAGRGEQLRVARERERAHGPLETTERAQTTQALDVPERGERIRRSGRQILAAAIELETYAVGEMSLERVHFG